MKRTTNLANASLVALLSLAALAACSAPAGDGDAATTGPDSGARDATADVAATGGLTDSSTPTSAARTSAAPSTAQGAPMQPATYVANAASGDMYEVQSSQLLLANSKDKELRQFAQRMLTDHRQTTQMLQQAARAGGQTLPPAMLDRHQQMIANLKAASTQSDPTAFDRLYRQQQLTAHAEAIELHRAMSVRGDVPAELAEFARQTLPKVQGHHDMLTGMPSASRAGMPGPGSTTASGAASGSGSSMGGGAAGTGTGSDMTRPGETTSGMPSGTGTDGGAAGRTAAGR